jgi:hypothetical protein
MTAVEHLRRRAAPMSREAIAAAWWNRADRSTNGLAALFGGLPLGAFVEDLAGPAPVPRAIAAVHVPALP